MFLLIFSLFSYVLGNLFPKVAEKLNQAALPVVDFQTCSKPAYWWDVLRPSMICAGYESPDELKSACQVSRHTQDKMISDALDLRMLFVCWNSLHVF